MPITSPGNDDDTGENHQPTLRKNTAEPVEQTLKQYNLKEGKAESTTVEFGPLITLGISTSFGLFLPAFQDGKAVYDPGVKITLKNGKWAPHPRSQFRINLKDISAIYQEVKEVDLRDSDAM